MTNQGTEPEEESSGDGEELSEQAARLVSTVRDGLNSDDAEELQRTKNAILGRVLAQGDDESSMNSVEGHPPVVGLIRPVTSKSGS